MWMLEHIHGGWGVPTAGPFPDSLLCLRIELVQKFNLKFLSGQMSYDMSFICMHTCVLSASEQASECHPGP